MESRWRLHRTRKGRGASIDYPKLALCDWKREHGVILKIVTINIRGNDPHTVRGRTTAPAGLISEKKSP